MMSNKLHSLAPLLATTAGALGLGLAGALYLHFRGRSRSTRKRVNLSQQHRSWGAILSGKIGQLSREFWLEHKLSSQEGESMVEKPFFKNLHLYPEYFGRCWQHDLHNPNQTGYYKNCYQKEVQKAVAVLMGPYTRKHETQRLVERKEICHPGRMIVTIQFRASRPLSATETKEYFETITDDVSTEDDKKKSDVRLKRGHLCWMGYAQSKEDSASASSSHAGDELIIAKFPTDSDIISVSEPVCGRVFEDDDDCVRALAHY